MRLMSRYAFSVMLVTALLVGGLWARSQEDYYPFIEYEKNRIQFGKPDALTHFFDKLRRLEKDRSGKVHILQIGDSHIQADISSNRIREHFLVDQRFPIGARGFLFPYHMAKTNNPENYAVSYSGEWEGELCSLNNHWCQWGLAGICAHTTNPYAAFSINPNNRQTRYDIHKVKVFYPTNDPESYRAEVLPEPGNFVSSEMVSDGYVEYTLDQPQRQVSIRLLKTDPQQRKFILQGISLESHNPGVTFSASGVNGAKVKSYLRCTDFTKNIQALRPDLVIISLGTNDAYYGDFNAPLFKQNYKYMIRQIRSVLPDVSILLVTPGDLYRRTRYRRYYPNPEIPIAHDQILELANETGVAVWDFFEIMGGKYSAKQWRLHDLYKSDYVHLTTKGYLLQGDLAYKALMDAYMIYVNQKEN